MRETADIMTDIACSGMSPEQMKLVMELTAALAGGAAPQRSKGAIRTERWREKKASQNVTERHGETEGFPDKEGPHTPKKITLPPEIISPHAREAIRVLSEVIGSLAAHFKRWNCQPPPPKVSDPQWTGFLETRKANPKGRKFTNHAYGLLCKRLAELDDAGWPPGDMIDRAIEHGWLTVYPPTEQRNGNRNRTDHPGGVWGAAHDAVRGAFRLE